MHKLIERKRIRHLFKFRYPKVSLFIIMVILSFVVFRNGDVRAFISGLGNWGYFGVFVAGVFFSFGFSSPFSAGFFITLNPGNLWLYGILGGVGALTADLFIFYLVRFSFEDEFKRLERTALVKRVYHAIADSFGRKIKMYLLYTFAGFLIASPLPDEAGIMILAGLARIRVLTLALISICMNTLGILILLSL